MITEEEFFAQEDIDCDVLHTFTNYLDLIEHRRKWMPELFPLGTEVTVVHPKFHYRAVVVDHDPFDGKVVVSNCETHKTRKYYPRYLHKEVEE